MLQGLDLYFKRFLLLVIVLFVKLALVVQRLDLPFKHIHLLQFYIHGLNLLLVVGLRVFLLLPKELILLLKILIFINECLKLEIQFLILHLDILRGHFL